ncbi:unnamed protein product [Polarella glacialis]|uniref:EamA domain-containing protein n=1 Tax=Polarella glacialis TaxID=89957 RepID=A0A813JG15_POLGL|nr:unnamed protein product [Polarella glacialis]CAE8679159.1 unnamed protein product [Polarella glacialis]
MAPTATSIGRCQQQEQQQQQDLREDVEQLRQEAGLQSQSAEGGRELEPLVARAPVAASCQAHNPTTTTTERILPSAAVFLPSYQKLITEDSRRLPGNPPSDQQLLAGGGVFVQRAPDMEVRPGGLANITARAACTIWAALVGASVALNLVITNHLNRRSDEPTLHSFYVSAMCTLLGGVSLIPQACLAQAPFRRPTKIWSLLGGLCVLTGFANISGSHLVGAQIDLLLQLLGMLSMALFLDARVGRITCSDKRRIRGFFIVVAGIGADSFHVGNERNTVQQQPLFAAVILVGVFVSGLGYAMQAKCNSQLSANIGGPARACIICAAVTLIGGIPIQAYISFGIGVRFDFALEDWPLWTLAGLQSAFYTGSLAVLPAKLGYTATYLAIMFGKLASSSILDAGGMISYAQPFTVQRALSLVLVLVGSGLFSSQPSADDPEPSSGTTGLHSDEQGGGRLHSAAQKGPPSTTATATWTGC